MVMLLKLKHITFNTLIIISEILRGEGVNLKLKVNMYLLFFLIFEVLLFAFISFSLHPIPFFFSYHSQSNSVIQKTTMLMHGLIQEFYGWEEVWVCGCVWGGAGEEGDEEGKHKVAMEICYCLFYISILYFVTFIITRNRGE